MEVEYNWGNSESFGVTPSFALGLPEDCSALPLSASLILLGQAQPSNSTGVPCFPPSLSLPRPLPSFCLSYQLLPLQAQAQHGVLLGGGRGAGSGVGGQGCPHAQFGQEEAPVGQGKGQV